MKIKSMTEIGILLAIGFVLHSFFPPIWLGMKPDFSLAMLFAVMIIKRDVKLALMAGFATGVFTAMTTGFPGGQVANIVDKTLTTLIIMIPLLRIRSNHLAFVGIVNFAGTILSGTIFLGTAALVSGLPGPMLILMATVVLPAAFINSVTGTILYSAILQSKQMLQRQA